MSDQWILVTGTAGFIGNHVALRLLEAGNQVLGVDNFNSYYSVQLKKDRHVRLESYKNYKGFNLDLCDYTSVEELFKNYQPIVVCHLAAQAGVRYSFVNPAAYQRSNLEGFFNVMEFAKAFKVRRFVFASSSSVYGGNTKLPFSEFDRVDQPKSLYAATKRSNELLAYSYTQLFGLQSIGLRFFTVYGPWGRPDMSIFLFTKAIFEGQPIEVFNSGDMQRDFTYVDDIVSGVTAALFKENLEPFELFNLGNHRSEDLMGLIELIEQAVGKKAEKRFMGMQPGDMKATYADISLATEKLGFSPKTTIKEGIPRFIEWYKGYFKG